MSKSYKYPIYKQRNSKSYKRLSNKKIRKVLLKLEIGFKSTKFFKTLVNPWDICDWRFKPRDEKDKLKSIRK